MLQDIAPYITVLFHNFRLPRPTRRASVRPPCSRPPAVLAPVAAGRGRSRQEGFAMK